MKKLRDIEVITPNFKKRLSGVTSTVIQLVPLQQRMGLGIAALGPGLPDRIPRIRLWRMLGLLRRPSRRPCRVWHARRNVEMIGGLILRHIFRAPLKLLFTSASQRQHKSFTRWLIRRMDAVIATSQKTACYLHVPNTVIMHGIDTERFCPAPWKDDSAKGDSETANIRLAQVESVIKPAIKTVGCFGRIRHQKGTDLFVDTMIRLLPDRPDWNAMIAGRTTVEHLGFEKQLREKIAAAGLSDRILFVGEHTDIERKYQQLSLFVAPQRWEGFGLTPLEAMACGVPVVSTYSGAIPEIVGDAGMLCQPNDFLSLYEAIGALVEDGAKRKTLSEAGRQHALDRFTLDAYAQGLGEVYRSIL